MDILMIAEAADSYRRECSNSFLNDEARKGQVYELSNISNVALTSLRTAVESIPLYDNCEIVILNSSADNGFPHTRPKNIVCLPDSMCKEEASPKFIETLIHEAIHVHQRLNRGLWVTSLQRVGWTPVNSYDIPPEFKELLRLNPDTILEPFWSWSKYYVPLCLFRNRSKPSLSDTAVQWLDLRTDSLFKEPPKGFKEAYPQHIHQMEHPYEIYAEIFAAKGLRTNEELEDALRAL